MKKLFLFFICIVPSFAFGADYTYIDAGTRIGVYREWDTIYIYETNNFYARNCKDSYTQITEFYAPGIGWGAKELINVGSEIPYVGYKCLDKGIYDAMKADETRKKSEEQNQIDALVTNKTSSQSNDILEKTKKEADIVILNNKVQVESQKLSLQSQKKAVLLKKRMELLQKQILQIQKQLDKLK